jgi:hypothetical protein
MGLVMLASATGVLAQAPPYPQTLSELMSRARRLGYVLIPAIDGDLEADERTEEGLAREMEAYFREAAPGIEQDKIGLHRLVRGFARLLLARGEISEQICNERIRAYNERYVPLAGFIDSREFDPAYGALLKEAYALTLLESPGGQVSLMQEVALLAGIPTTGQVVPTRRGDYFYDTVSRHYPGIRALAEAQRLRVYAYLVAINPVFRADGYRAGAAEREFREFRVLAGVAFIPEARFLDEIAAQP